MPFLNQQEGDNDCRNNFIINRNKFYVAELEFKFETPGFAVKHASECAVELSALR